MRSIDGRSTQTFNLLWCQGCGHAQEPANLRVPDFVRDVPLACTDCGEGLALIECFIRGSLDHKTHTYVAHMSDLRRVA